MKYCINAVPESGNVSDGKELGGRIFVFDTNEAIKSVHHSSVIVLNCEKFVVDETSSSGNWRDAFNFNEEPPQGILVTVNPGYKASDIMPYSE
jgi:hypothetical protein